MTTKTRQLEPAPRDVERFWERVAKCGWDECWVWLGDCRDGYGRVTVASKNVVAHRFAWELEYGPIPEGIFVLHRCDNRPCVNAGHLFLGTQKDNMDDMVQKHGNPFSNKTHCKRGHPFTGVNLYVAPTGKRGCHICMKMRARRTYLRRLAKAA